MLDSPRPCCTIDIAVSDRELCTPTDTFVNKIPLSTRHACFGAQRQSILVQRLRRLCQSPGRIHAQHCRTHRRQSTRCLGLLALNALIVCGHKWIQLFNENIQSVSDNLGICEPLAYKTWYANRIAPETGTFFRHANRA